MPDRTEKDQLPRDPVVARHYLKLMREHERDPSAFAGGRDIGRLALLMALREKSGGSRGSV